MIGTTAYMSPEQVRARDLDTRTDLFSFGAVMYEMATGDIPFRGESSAVICSEILKADPVPPSRLNPDIPPKLEDVILRLLEKDKDLRYQHASDLRSDLQRLKRDSETGRISRVGTSTSSVSAASQATPPSSPSSAAPHSTGGGVAIAVASDTTHKTAAVETPQPGLQPRRTFPWMLVTPLVIVLFAGIAGFFYWKQHTKAPQITDRDQIILADFNNQTGDPVFDSTLKEALAIQLEQSPMLQLVGDAELHNNLQYLGQARDQKITPELAQQIGQRLGVKAYLAGTIAPLGNSYVISINAVNCITSEVFAREQETASDKADVLKAVSSAATKLRAHLGESMASIQKLSTPYTNVTTSSLQAFHAFSLGEDQHRMGHDLPEAERYYLEAVKLDPTFAMALPRLGVVYNNVGSTSKGLDYLKKAYDLRERVTERERMYIESQYALEQFDMPKALESYKLFVDTYPHDAAALNNIATLYSTTGDIEASIDAFKKAWEGAKWDNIAATNLASTLILADRLEEAEKYLKEAEEQGGGGDVSFRSTVLLADFLRNRPDWDKQVAWAANRPDGFLVEATAAMVYFDQGRMREARQRWEHTGQRTEQQHMNDTAGTLVGTWALEEALTGNCGNARTAAHRALQDDTSFATVPNAALAMALCGDGAAAIKEIDRVAAEQPANTMISSLYSPQVRAAAALSQHKYDEVAKLLEPASSYAQVSKIPQLLGLASLEMHNPQQAISDFKLGLRYRALSLQQGAGGTPQNPDYTLCLLGLARAQVLANDHAGAIETYQKLLANWKNADPDYQLAQDAKKELAALTK
jgi:tetratricopeptide (TPR) repeat protein